MVLGKTLTLPAFEVTLKPPGPPGKLGIEAPGTCYNTETQAQAQTLDSHLETSVLKIIHCTSGSFTWVRAPSHAAASKKSSMTTLATVAPFSQGESP